MTDYKKEHEEIIDILNMWDFFLGTAQGREIYANYTDPEKLTTCFIFRTEVERVKKYIETLFADKQTLVKVRQYVNDHDKAGRAEQETERNA